MRGRCGSGGGGSSELRWMLWIVACDAHPTGRSGHSALARQALAAGATAARRFADARRRPYSECAIVRTAATQCTGRIQRVMSKQVQSSHHSASLIRQRVLTVQIPRCRVTSVVRCSSTDRSAHVRESWGARGDSNARRCARGAWCWGAVQRCEEWCAKAAQRYR